MRSLSHLAHFRPCSSIPLYDCVHFELASTQEWQADPRLAGFVDPCLEETAFGAMVTKMDEVRSKFLSVGVRKNW